MDIHPAGTTLPQMLPAGSQRRNELNSIFGTLTEGTSTRLFAGGYVNSLLAPAYVAHQAALLGEQTLWLTGPEDAERGDEIVAVLRDLYGLTVTTDAADDLAEVCVMSLEDFARTLRDDDPWLDATYVIFDNIADLIPPASPFRALHDAMRARGKAVLVSQWIGADAHAHPMFDATLDPFANRLHDDAGDTPFGNRADLLRARMKEKYEPDSTLSCIENEYRFIRTGSLAERYRVLCELVGLAVQIDQDAVWVLDRYDDLFSGTHARFGSLTLAGWVYATAPRFGLVDTFAFDVACAMGDAVPA